VQYAPTMAPRTVAILAAYSSHSLPQAIAAMGEHDLQLLFSVLWPAADDVHVQQCMRRLLTPDSQKCTPWLWLFSSINPVAMPMAADPLHPPGNAWVLVTTPQKKRVLYRVQGGTHISNAFQVKSKGLAHMPMDVGCSFTRAAGNRMAIYIDGTAGGTVVEVAGPPPSSIGSVAPSVPSTKA